MKRNIFSLLILIVASILSIFVIGVILFGGGSLIGGINDGSLNPIDEIIKDFFPLLVLILYVVSVVIAWFKQNVGSILITIFALAQFALINEAELLWLQLSLLPVGPLLFFFGSHKKRLTNKGNFKTLSERNK